MRLKALVFAALAFIPSHVEGQSYQTFGSFRLPADQPEVIELSGDITPASTLDFRRALQARPDATIIDLTSNGGDVFAGLTIGFEVHDRQLDTRIAPGNGCYSACAYVFFAGKQRVADGELGVHQIADVGPGETNLADAQFTIADIIDALATFGVEEAVLTAMFRTPSDAIYVFSKAEIEALAINRNSHSDVDNLAASTVAVQSAVAENVTVVAKSSSQPLPDILNLVLPVPDRVQILPILVQLRFADGFAQDASPACSRPAIAGDRERIEDKSSLWSTYG